MKLTAVSILKWNGEQEANLLGLSADLSNFGYFQRGSVKEMLIFVSRTVAKRTQPGQRQTVQNEEYFCHVHNRDGLVGIAFVDKDYPSRAAFSIVNKILDDFLEASGNNWRTVREDTQDAIPILDAAITKYQVCPFPAFLQGCRGCYYLQDFCLT
jgi:synaptobrevin homolog YKT6